MENALVAAAMCTSYEQNMSAMMICESSRMFEIHFDRFFVFFFFSSKNPTIISNHPSASVDDEPALKRIVPCLVIVCPLILCFLPKHFQLNF